MPKNSFRIPRFGSSVQELLAQAEASDKLDDALKHLAKATNANKKVCTQVQRSQSSGALKLVTLPPPPLWIPAE